MKTRLQLAKGYVDGTLEEDELNNAKENPVIWQEIQHLISKPIIVDETKNNKRRKK